MPRLPWEDQALQLDLGVLGVEDDQLVAVRVAGEVAEPRLRVQVVLLAPHPFEARHEALLLVGALDQFAPGLALDAFAAPVQLEEDVAVEVGVDVVEVDLDVAHPKVGSGRDRVVGDGLGADARVGGRRAGVGVDRLLAQGSGLVLHPLDQRRARLVVDQRVHRVEALERVLAVEDAGLVDLVGFAPLRVEDAAAEVTVDRGAADQHREVVPALVQLRRCRSASASRSRRAAPRGRSRRLRSRPRPR